MSALGGCEAEVERVGQLDVCGQPAAALRIDDGDPEPWPACTAHLHGVWDGEAWSNVHEDAS